MTTTTLFTNELPCTCETCMTYIRLTEGDYEHSFVIAHTSGLKQCIKPTTLRTPFNASKSRQRINCGTPPTSIHRSPPTSWGSFTRATRRYLPFEIC